jgi:lipoyl(octanoyl) transferase
MKNKKVFVEYCGLIDYAKAWAYQEKLFSEIVEQKIKNRNLPEAEQQLTPNYLLFCEHPHVYTLGRNGKLNHLLANEELLKKLNAQYFPINRGGDITYHGPGQLVGYPVIDLENFFTDIHKYLRLIEEAVILTLSEYGVSAGRIEGLTGVWIDHVEQRNPRKICAIGVRASRWVAMHGFALNVNTDLNYFNYIVPCGIKDKAVTSLQKEIGKIVDVLEVAEKMKKHLAQLFEMQLSNE